MFRLSFCLARSANRVFAHGTVEQMLPERLLSWTACDGCFAFRKTIHRSALLRCGGLELPPHCGDPRSHEEIGFLRSLLVEASNFQQSLNLSNCKLSLKQNTSCNGHTGTPSGKNRRENCNVQTLNAQGALALFDHGGSAKTRNFVYLPVWASRREIAQEACSP